MNVCTGKTHMHNFHEITCLSNDVHNHASLISILFYFYDQLSATYAHGISSLGVNFHHRNKFCCTPVRSHVVSDCFSCRVAVWRQCHLHHAPCLPQGRRVSGGVLTGGRSLGNANIKPVLNLITSSCVCVNDVVL